MNQLGEFGGNLGYGEDAAMEGKGNNRREIQVNALAKFIKAVKEDTVTQVLEKELFEREARIRR